MTPRTFFLVSGLIFSLVALLHLLRLLLGWDAVIGGWAVPRWSSVIALPVAGFLAYQAFRLRK